MTSVMTSSHHAETGCEATYAGPTCWECGGPVLQYAGSVHGWRCRGCLTRYIDAGQARWEARSDKARERVSRNLLSSNDIQSSVTATVDAGRVVRSYVPHPPGADPTPQPIDQLTREDT